MKPTAPDGLQARAAQWDDLTRWKRAELGRALRRLGWSYGEIRELIPVPKGTLSNWCREIRLTGEQVSAIKDRTGSMRGVPRDTQWRRREEIERIESEARAEVGRTKRFLDPEPEFVFALNLHAENNEIAARQAWRRLLGLPRAEFTKTFVKPDGTGHRKNHLPQGVCRVRVRRSTDVWIRTMAWIEALPPSLGILH